MKQNGISDELLYILSDFLSNTKQRIVLMVKIRHGRIFIFIYFFIIRFILIFLYNSSNAYKYIRLIYAKWIAHVLDTI